MNGPAKALNTHCGQQGSNQLKLRFIISVQVKEKKKKERERERETRGCGSFFLLQGTQNHLAAWHLEVT